MPNILMDDVIEHSFQLICIPLSYSVVYFRYGNKSSEVKIAHVMTVHWNCLPAELGVKQKLRLESHDQNLHDIPYQPAIEELRTISSKVTLLGKLESLGMGILFLLISSQPKIFCHSKF